jgi:hypothetical protein
LVVLVEPLLIVRRVLREQLGILHRRLLVIVRDGAGSTFAQQDSGYLRDDQSRRGGLFRRLFGGSR